MRTKCAVLTCMTSLKWTNCRRTPRAQSSGSTGGHDTAAAVRASGVRGGWAGGDDSNSSVSATSLEEPAAAPGHSSNSRGPAAAATIARPRAGHHRTQRTGAPHCTVRRHRPVDVSHTDTHTTTIINTSVILHCLHNNFPGIKVTYVMATGYTQTYVWLTLLA